jgi:hypothetical protein
MNYTYVDRILKIFEANLISAPIRSCYLVTNVNPVKTTMLLMEFLQRISDTYPITEFRSNALREFCRTNLRKILIRLYLPLEVKE